MTQAALIVLARAIHVMGGVIWAGAVVVMALAVAPVLMRHAAEGSGRWLGMIGKRTGILSGVSALLTVASGIYLFAVLHAHDESAGAKVLASGALAAVLSFVVGIFIARPAGLKLAQMQEAGQVDAAVATALRTRALAASRITLALLALSVLAMGTFRYVQVLAG